MITPRLVVADATAAIAFYASVFGAVERVCHRTPAGTVIHAELGIAGQPIYLKDADGHDPDPHSLGGSPVLLTVTTDDPDAIEARAVAAGATAIYPVADRDYGLREGRFADPFGHLWILSGPLKGTSPD